MNLRLCGVLKGSRSPAGAAFPVSWTRRDSMSSHKAWIISNPEHDSGFLPSYEVSPQWSTFQFPQLEDWHHGCAAWDRQQVRMPCQYGPKSPESNVQGTSLSPHPQEWRQLRRQTVLQVIAWPLNRYRTRPVINFNEWYKTRGQSLNFSILLELILCLTWLDSGEPNLPGLNQNELTTAHLFLVEVITAKPFLAAVKHTILGSFLGRCAFFLKEHEKLLILIFCINRVWVCRL